MKFVYLHVGAVRGVDVSFEEPWPTLTLVVLLEAIFLSTFVMIGQNRQAAFQQAKANHDFNEQELELKTNMLTGSRPRCISERRERHRRRRRGGWRWSRARQEYEEAARP